MYYLLSLLAGMMISVIGSIFVISGLILNLMQDRVLRERQKVI